MPRPNVDGPRSKRAIPRPSCARSAKTKRPSLIELAARATNRSIESLHPTSRLDRDVSGVVTFACDAASGERLAKARAEGKYRRRYVALAIGTMNDDVARWTWAIVRDRDPRK